MDAYEAGWRIEHSKVLGVYGWWVVNPYGEHIAGPYDTRNEALAKRDELFTDKRPT